MFKSIIKTALLFIGVIIVFTVVRVVTSGPDGAGARAGERIGGLLVVIVVAAIGWAISAAFSGLKSLAQRSMKKVEETVENRENGGPDGHKS